MRTRAKGLARTARSGFTMVEVTIGMGLLVLMSMTAVMASSTGLGAFESARLNNSVEARLHRATARVSRELMPAGWDMVGPANLDNEFGSTFITFQEPADFAAGAIVWGPINSIGIELDPGEQDDDIDNDGDGVVDERQLVLTRDLGGANERRVVLCRSVREMFEGEEDNNGDDNGNLVTDEMGFNVRRVGDVLEIRLSVEESSPKLGTVVRSVTTSVRLRN